MVREANTKQAAAEKQLREARGKVSDFIFGVGVVASLPSLATGLFVG